MGCAAGQVIELVERLAPPGLAEEWDNAGLQFGSRHAEVDAVLVALEVSGEVLREALDKDAKSRLQEWSQAHLGATPVYRTIEERGPDHAKTFTVQVLIAGVVYGEGEGPSKQAAAQAAALQAFERLQHLYALGQLPAIAYPDEEERPALPSVPVS